MKIMVTGGCGFIGSAVIRRILEETPHEVLNIDCLTYSGNPESLAGYDQRYADRDSFEKLNICDQAGVQAALEKHRPAAIMHLAAESHVDRSIDGPVVFMETNIMGTFHLLQAARGYYHSLKGADKDRFRFHHVSTDEVFGSLKEDGGYFHEDTPYSPNSPYSASKAASDHLVRAWSKTFALPVLITNCSNNYGPYQFPEKLIPLMIRTALDGKPLPVYGDGLNVRDWLYVDDHAAALLLVLEKGKTGETYNIGGCNEMTNLKVVHTICDLLDEMSPPKSGRPRRELISFVEDRPGHDRRYAIDPEKIRHELGFTPAESFASGIRKTVRWYLDHGAWVSRILDGSYQGERQGLGAES